MPTPSFSTSLKTFDPSQIEELIGRSYLTQPDSADCVFHARIVHAITEMDASRVIDPAFVRFVVQMDDPAKTEEIVAYNDIVQFVTQELEHDNTDQFWKFKHICGHQGPLAPTNPAYNGSSWNVQVEWEDGSHTYEPLFIVAADDPVSCALYAKENNLLNTAG